MRGWRKFPASAVGRVDARFVLVGEAPGIASIVNGRQWTGAGGMILRREIRRLGLDLEDLFYLTNAVKCWPAASRRGGRGRPGNRSPLPAEARRCRPFLEAELEAIRPEVVVAVGGLAARAVLDQPVRLPADHGRRYRVGDREVVVLLHPANANRHPSVWPSYRDSLLALFGELAARAGFPVLEVAAAVIERSGRILVTRRDPAKHMGGLWEFPGGKREPGESIEACLHRELDEELGIRVRRRRARGNRAVGVSGAARPAPLLPVPDRRRTHPAARRPGLSLGHTARACRAPDAAGRRRDRRVAGGPSAGKPKRPGRHGKIWRSG